MKLLKKKLADNMGVTLVELLTVVSLLLMVFSLGYGVFSFGTNSFLSAEKRLMLQQNSRQIANIITKELRFATTLQLLQSPPSTGDLQTSNYNYIVFNYDEKKISQYSNGVLKYATEGIIDGITFKTTFDPGFNRTLLNFSMNSSTKYLSQTLSYPLASNLILLNIAQSFSPDSSAIGVKYTKP
jgi:hypothetical protein